MTRPDPAPDPVELTSGLFRRLDEAAAPFYPQAPGLRQALRRWWLEEVLPGPAAFARPLEEADLVLVRRILADVLRRLGERERVENPAPAPRAPMSQFRADDPPAPPRAAGFVPTSPDPSDPTPFLEITDGDEAR